LSLSWNSATVSNGSHAISANAYNKSNTQVGTASVSVNVQNGGAPPTSSAFRIHLDSDAHARFGLYYPGTYVIGIPSGSSGLKAQYRYDTASWPCPISKRVKITRSNRMRSALMSVVATQSIEINPVTCPTCLICYRCVVSLVERLVGRIADAEPNRRDRASSVRHWPCTTC
jgi:hypothetical protein